MHAVGQQACAGGAPAEGRAPVRLERRAHLARVQSADPKRNRDHAVTVITLTLPLPLPLPLALTLTLTITLTLRAYVDHADAQRGGDGPHARRESAHELGPDAEDRRAAGAAVDHGRKQEPRARAGPARAATHGEETIEQSAPG